MPAIGGGCTTRTSASWMPESRFNSSAEISRLLYFAPGPAPRPIERDQNHGAEIRRIGEGGPAKPDDAPGRRDAGRLQGDAAPPPLNLVGAGQRRAGRQLHHPDQIA